MYLMDIEPPKNTGSSWIGGDVSGSVNWVTEGAVTDVKNQGNCGSCWAFSIVGVTESQKFISTGVLGDFSEQ